MADREIAVAIELFHIGEVLVAEILSRLQGGGALDQVRDATSGTSLSDDLGAAGVELPACFEADLASVVVNAEGASFSCDGAQTIDVLCVGRNGLAVAIEAKLGETRMARGEFRKRFCVRCEKSRHLDSRLRGSMVAVLERDLPFPGAELVACIDGHTWSVHQTWWLVVRRRVWQSWRKTSPVRNARVLLFEDLASAYGSEREFNDLVQESIGTDFARRWRIYE